MNHKNPLGEVGDVPVEKSLVVPQLCGAALKFSAPGNDFVNRKQKNGFGFGEFFFATFGGFLQTTRLESKEYFGGFFGCNVLIVQAGNHWGLGKQLRVVPKLLLGNSV